MASINVSDFEQIGGFDNIKIVTVDEIISGPEILTNQNAANVVFAAAPQNVDVLQVSESLSIKETPRYNKSGLLYKINCDITIQNQTSEIDNFLNEYNFKKIVIIGVKHFEQQKLYGSKQHPLKLNYEMVNGKKLQDGSYIKLKITGNIPQKPVFIEG